MVCYCLIDPCFCICLSTAAVCCFLGTLDSILAKDLQYEVFYYRSHTFSENTKRTYKSYIDSYTRFCLLMNIPAVPASTHNIGMYAAFLARSMKPSSVRQYVNTIGLLHKEFGLANPLTDNHFLNSLFRGIRRVNGDSHVQKLPITVDLLFRLFKLIDLKSSFHSSFWAICLTAFYGMFRKSNLLPTTAKHFAPDKQLTKSDFTFCSWGVLVHVKWSKTIQFRDKIIQIPFSYIRSSPLCPVRAILHAFSFTRHCPSNSQAFTWIDTSWSYFQVFTYSQFIKHLRACLISLGIDPTYYAGHSFRRGGASLAYQAGLSVEAIKLLGDWKSDAVLLYLTVPLSVRLQSNNQLTKYILSMF